MLYERRIVYERETRTRKPKPKPDALSQWRTMEVQRNHVTWNIWRTRRRKSHMHQSQDFLNNFAGQESWWITPAATMILPTISFQTSETDRKHICFLLVALTSQQHAIVSQRRICTNKVTYWDRSCRSNFLPHPVTVYWHRVDQFQRWPYNARRLAG